MHWSSPKKLTFTYIFALSLLAALSIGTYLTLSGVIRTQQNGAALINVSGRQRMLSQRIAKFAYHLVSSRDDKEREVLRNHLLRAIDLMEVSHFILIHGNEKMRLPGINSPRIKAMLFEDADQLDVQVRKFIFDARVIARSPVHELSFNNPHLEAIHKASLSDLLDKLDQVVHQYQVDDEKNVMRIQLMHEALTVINLLVILLMGVFLFRPMVRLAQKDIDSLSELERSKSDFIATISHEIRTPMTSIHGSLGLVMGGMAGDISERSKKLLDIALKNSRRLIRLINNVLDIEKIESGKISYNFEKSKIMTIIEEAVEETRPYADQYGVKYMVKSELSRETKVMADGEKIIGVLVNLLSNAARFSPANGNVIIAAERLDRVDADSLKNESESLSGSLIRVSVTDHGTGISEEFRERIFQKFAQAKHHGKGGSGLGLSIAKSIIEKHGGKIGFESEPEVRTTFYFDVPECD